ncbi:uncharacterized protein MONBRDRAFT_34619 [Monosiga brevicollis MX1]|uniref:V-type proton ATPase subunit F n=1 Tax=Monosiga brevicollis TaxID=81824 RepID=A9VCW9_MONBE|nr:uncharacterized protein MONBRDRAFT_34619 [Monosiga brevicollis MX1]EDQ84665.1 predicted protein [Monosiga brevicollis MX1]|eukprot:XP_001750569.1 hypothetical protein [Monosiga brevicollis MX1]
MDAGKGNRKRDARGGCKQSDQKGTGVRVWINVEREKREKREDRDEKRERERRRERERERREKREERREKREERREREREERRERESESCRTVSALPRLINSIMANNSRQLIAVIGDEDTCTGFLLAGVGDINVKHESNYLVVNKGVLTRLCVPDTTISAIEDAFRHFVERDDIAIILINQMIAEDIRYLLDNHTEAIPAVLEIPSKEQPYDSSKDSILRRAKVGGLRYTATGTRGMFSAEDFRLVSCVSTSSAPELDIIMVGPLSFNVKPAGIEPGGCDFGPCGLCFRRAMSKD